MAPFRFRLARVLRWHEAQSRLEQNRLRQAAEVVRLSETRLAEQKTADLEVERDVIYAKAVSAQDLFYLASYRQKARERAVEFAEKRRQAETAMETQRRAAVAAELRLRRMEKVRDRKLSEYKYQKSQEMEEIGADSYTSGFVRSLNTQTSG